MQQPQITTPCSVPWDQMKTLADGNRFCNSCQKEVHDLTAATPEEILQRYQAAGGNLCGRMVQRLTIPSLTLEKSLPHSLPHSPHSLSTTKWRLAASTAAILLAMQAQAQTSAPYAPPRQEQHDSSLPNKVAVVPTPVQPANPAIEGAVPADGTLMGSGLASMTAGIVVQDSLRLVHTAEGSDTIKVQTEEPPHIVSLCISGITLGLVTVYGGFGIPPEALVSSTQDVTPGGFGMPLGSSIVTNVHNLQPVVPKTLPEIWDNHAARIHETPREAKQTSFPYFLPAPTITGRRRRYRKAKKGMPRLHWQVFTQRNIAQQTDVAQHSATSETRTPTRMPWDIDYAPSTPPKQKKR